MRSSYKWSIPATLLVVVMVGAVWSAPGSKDKSEPEKPITPEQLKAAENRMSQFGLAWHNFHDTMGRMPGNVYKDGKPLLSWRVQILPYIEEAALYKELKLDEPWDSEHNKKLIPKLPKFYAPIRGKAKEGETFYQSFTGNGGVLRNPGARMADITDGTSNTVMVVEGEKPVIWTKPDDIVYDGKKAPAIGGMFSGASHITMCDGSPRFLPKGFDPAVLQAMITANGGEVVNVNQAIENAQKK